MSHGNFHSTDDAVFSICEVIILRTRTVGQRREKDRKRLRLKFEGTDFMDLETGKTEILGQINKVVCKASLSRISMVVS